jgi:hypothetical protein
MNKSPLTALALLAGGLLLCSTAVAGETLHQQHTIKIKTADAEVIEADLQDLAVGESKTFTTDSGKAIDLIRTANGVEVYVDGEMIDLAGGNLHEAHKVIHKSVSVECLSEGDAEAECEHDVVFIGEGDADSEGHANVIHKRFEVVCAEGEECDEMVWVDADGDFNYEVETLHEGDDGHHVIVIEKQLETTSSN